MSAPDVSHSDVLICDDERDIRVLYKAAFERAGASVAIAGDGDEAIDLAGRIHPQLVVLDLMMPKRNGFATLGLLRALRPESRVVVVSGYSSPDNAARALDLGALAVYDKLEFVGEIPKIVEELRAAS